MKKLFTILYRTIALAYAPTIFLLSFIPRSTDGGTSYTLNFLLFFLYSFPFYCALLEVCATLCYIYGERADTHLEKAIRTIRLLLSVGIFLTLIDISEGLKFALVMAVVWCVLAAFGFVMHRFHGKKAL